MSASNTFIYIPFVGEQYKEEDIHHVFSNFQIGTIRSVVFLDHNYMIGTSAVGSIREQWGRPVIIEMESWQQNDYTRALNFAMNMGMTRSSLVELNGPYDDYWLIQKYEPTDILIDQSANIP